jgi:hypothetical protein
MGSCRYCGRPAGLLSSAHKECQKAHNRACQSVTGLLDNSLSSDTPLLGARRSVQEMATIGRIAPADLRKLVLDSMVRWIDGALGDHVLSIDEEKRLTEFTEAFDINLPDLDEAGCKLKLVKGQILTDLSEGKVPQRVNISGGLPISLSKNESIIFVFQDAEFQRLRTRTQYVGSSNGMSVRIMKGVYLRSSDYRGERIQSSEVQSVGTGLLAVTNKNLFFYGPEIVKTPLKKIVGVQPYSDGIGVFTEGQNAKPQIFKLADPFFAANLISLANSLH